MSYNIRRVAVIGAGTMGGGIAALVRRRRHAGDAAGHRARRADARGAGQRADARVRRRCATVSSRSCWSASSEARPAALFTLRRCQPDHARQLEDDLELIARGRLDRRGDRRAAGAEARADGADRAGAQARQHRFLQHLRHPDRIRSREGRSADFRAHFLGTHFFNPPRYLKLLEVIPTADTRPEVVEAMRSFAEKQLGKGVVHRQGPAEFHRQPYRHAISARCG